MRPTSLKRERMRCLTPVGARPRGKNNYRKRDRGTATRLPEWMTTRSRAVKQYFPLRWPPAEVTVKLRFLVGPVQRVADGKLSKGL